MSMITKVSDSHDSHDDPIVERDIQWGFAS